jgi:integrative and conjugative element protein (TIGR02256 family)
MSATNPNIWCSSHAMDTLSRLAADMAPLETGGCLAGYYARNSEDAVVTNVIGPGPNATHMRTRFVSDRVFDDESLAALWETSRHTIRYIGDWHTHPGGSSGPSLMDKAFMKHALRSRDAALKYSLVAIVYGDLTEARFWCLRPRSLWMLSSFSELNVIRY